MNHLKVFVLSFESCPDWFVLKRVSSRLFVFSCSFAFLQVRWLRHRQQGDGNVDIRQRVRISYRGRWGDRGWIVMLRCRYRKSLLRNTYGWPRRPALFSKRRPSATTTGIGLSAADLELVEAGRRGWSFEWIVGAVVEIEEEGVFRNIVTYI